jgi:uncharacterized protein YggE
MRTKLFFLISILLMASLLTACGTIAKAQSDQPTATGEKVTRTLSVNGTGKAYLVPDIAYINIGVHTEGKNAAEAMALNNVNSQKVIDSVKAAGVDEKDIQTTNFSIYPQQSYDQNGKPTGEITYMVDNTIYVTVRDLTKIGDLLDAAVQAGANNIYGIQFDVSDKSAALSQAREAAVKDAQIAAQEFAKAAGVELGPVQTISSYDSSPVPMAEGKGGGMAVAEAASVPVQAGQMVVTVNVSMVFEIR